MLNHYHLDHIATCKVDLLLSKMTKTNNHSRLLSEVVVCHLVPQTSTSAKVQETRHLVTQKSKPTTPLVSPPDSKSKE